MNLNNLVVMSLIAAEVASYDGPTRKARIRIPGLTDGSDLLPLADIMYSLGDNPALTEIELLPDDKIWIAFQGGDSRKPIIMGFRCPETNNILSLRRWHKENITLDADENMTLQSSAFIVMCDTANIVCQTLDVTAQSATVTALSVEVEAQTVAVTASTSATVTAPTTSISGNVSIGGNLDVAGTIS